MKNILITGGCGHIGSQLFRSIEGNITVVDNFLMNRYCSLFNVDRPIKFIDKCISEITTEELKKIDIVIHLAAITNAEKSFTNRGETEHINTLLTSEFINRCDKAGCRFIFPSSTSVYGVSADVVHEDDDSFLNPQSPYAETKIKIEKRLSTYKSGHIILRLGTIFGVSPGMRFHTAINKFCFEAATGSPLTVWRENYDQRRPYLGLNDAVDAISFLIQNEAWNETYNILTGNYKLSDIIAWIKEAVDITINMVDTPLVNQFSYEVSDEKIKSIGFKPTDNLFNEINKTLHKLRNLR